MGTTLIGQTGLYAADRAAVESKIGNGNVTTPVPTTAARIARRLGRQLKKSIAIHNPALVRLLLTVSIPGPFKDNVS